MNIPDITPRGDIESLPKWAQQYIRALSNKIDGLEKDIEGVENAASDISWWTASHNSVGIPERATIEFRLVGHYGISVNLRDGLLHINSDAGSLKVYPRAANDISIGIEDR